MWLIFGMISFLLFFAGDLNDAYWHRKWLKPAFLLGFVLLAAATAIAVVAAFPDSPDPVNIVFLMAAVAFGVLMIWALFFSFPPKQAYVETSAGREAYTGGMYALCRHPGVIWFCLMYGCLIPGAGFPAVHALVYCILNIMLAWIEDRFIFPEVFSNYPEYKRHTPFLIPTRKSVGSWINSFDKTKERG